MSNNRGSAEYTMQPCTLVGQVLTQEDGVFLLHSSYYIHLC